MLYASFGHLVPRGLEPRTLRLLAVRSNQLSYETPARPTATATATLLAKRFSSKPFTNSVAVAVAVAVAGRPGKLNLGRPQSLVRGLLAAATGAQDSQHTGL